MDNPPEIFEVGKSSRPRPSPATPYITFSMVLIILMGNPVFNRKAGSSIDEFRDGPVSRRSDHILIVEDEPVNLELPGDFPKTGEFPASRTPFNNGRIIPVQGPVLL